jgi:hypothetical protein
MNKELDTILSSSETNGGLFWSRTDGDIHAPAGYSTIDVLNTLGEIGVRHSDNQVVTNAIAFLFDYYDGRGAFTYAPQSSKLPCLTARILAALGKLGYRDDERLETCYFELLKTQQPDGGWRCATVKLGKARATDASNPGTTLYVLDAFRFRKNSAAEARKLAEGVAFLLDHWDTKVPLGPCQFGIGSRFLAIEYPFLRYNLFYYVYVLSKYKKAILDKRYNEALRCLQAKTKDDQIKPENPHKAWAAYSFSTKNVMSESATKRWLEIIGK